MLTLMKLLDFCHLRSDEEYHFYKGQEIRSRHLSLRIILKPGSKCGALNKLHYIGEVENFCKNKIPAYLSGAGENEIYVQIITIFNSVIVNK